MPTLKIDGREITVEDGIRVIEAAERAGIEIPRFCYHPALSVAANCRMCLVEINGGPKLVPSCHAIVQDGMEVVTNSERVAEARRAVLEFILLHHPVDCPICDQAGECDLQDQYFEYDYRPSRHNFPKQHKSKAHRLGPQIVYDGERCINCTRCVRFCDEIARSPQIRQVQRGEKTYIDVFPGTTLDNPYSMCVADVCPVGAMTTEDFRFKCRVWFMHGIDTVCGECSRGCSIRVDVYKDEIQRVMPRYNPNVNQYWACDHGRLAYHGFQEGRLTAALIDGREAPADEALSGVARALKDAGPGAAVVLTPFLTCEDAYALLTVLKDVAPGATVFLGGREAGDEDDVLIRADKNPNRAGVEMVAGVVGVQPRPIEEIVQARPEVVLVFGVGHAKVLGGALDAAGTVAVFDQLRGSEVEKADYAIPTAAPYEMDGTWLNEFGVLQRVRPAVPLPGDALRVHEIAARIAAAAEGTVPPRSPGELFDAMAEAVPSIAGKGLRDVGPFGMKLGDAARDEEAEGGEDNP